MPNNNRPLWERLFIHYRDEIRSGHLAEGSRLPSEMEMAAAHGVSRITATRALKELETAGLIHRIKGSGSYVSPAGRETPGNREPSGTGEGMRIISLVVPFADGFSEDFVRGIESAARNAGYFVTVHNSDDDAAAEAQILEDLMNSGSRGIVLYPIGLRQNMDVFSRLIIRRLPVVLIDRRIPGLDLPIVRVDNRKGFGAVVGHLLDSGHRRVVIAGESLDGSSSEAERYAGFCRAHLMRDVPLPAHHAYTIAADADGETDHAAACRRMLEDLRSLPPETRPTAVAAMNDETARIILTATLEAGLDVPGDLSVTGFDNLPFAAHLPVPLTTVAQPAFEIGETAARLLLERIARPETQPESRSVPSKLVIRESSGPLMPGGGVE